MGGEYGELKFNLDSWLEGFGPFVCPPGQSTHYINFTYNCMVNGIEIINDQTAYGDKINLESQYYIPPLSVWKRYKKFGKNWNIKPSTPDRIILFPTEPQNGVRFKLIYENNSVSDIKIWVNLFKFVTFNKIDTSQGQEGTDW